MEVAGRLCEQENVTELCEPCKVENLSNQADGFCKDCDEFMCQKCFRDHLKGKYCRNHVLDKLSGAQLQRKLRAREEKCKTHTSEPVKYYCSLHDFIGCGDCIVSNHGKCEPEFIKDLAMNLEKSSEFKSLISQLQKSDVEKVKSEAQIACYRKENCMLLAKAIRKIKEFRRDIDCWLDKMETNIEAEVRKIADDNEKTFSELQQKFVEISDDIDRINQLLDSNIHHGENLFIRMIECKPEVGATDKTLSKIKSKLIFQSYTYEQGEDIQEMLKSVNKLGNIKVVTKTENKQSNEQPTEDDDIPHLAQGSCLTTDSEPGDVWDCTRSNVQDFEYPFRAELEEKLENIRQKAILEKEEKESLQQAYNKLKTELEEELEHIRQKAILEKEEKESLQQAYNLLKTELETELEKTKQMAILKEEKESLQQAYNILKKELEAQEAVLSRERENSSVMITERDQTIILLKQVIISLKDLNTSLNSQLDSRNQEYGLLESKSIARHNQDHRTIDTLQSELKKTRDEYESLSHQILVLQLQGVLANKNTIDLQQQRESAMCEISALKVQLKQKDEEYETLACQSKVRQKQDNNKYILLQSELKRNSENYEKERESLNCQIQDFMRQRMYNFPDPRAAGFFVGKRVKGTGIVYMRRIGTVTAVDRSGYVDVQWADGQSDRCEAGARGKYRVKLLLTETIVTHFNIH